jgi:hypothetical protein
MFKRSLHYRTEPCPWRAPGHRVPSAEDTDDGSGTSGLGRRGVCNTGSSKWNPGDDLQGAKIKNGHGIQNVKKEGETHFAENIGVLAYNREQHSIRKQRLCWGKGKVALLKRLKKKSASGEVTQKIA